jgi:hypothetical protein
MEMIKPQIQYVTRESLRDWQNDYSNRKSKGIVKTFKTYRELKKALPAILAIAYDPESEHGTDTVFVVRSKHDSGWGYCEFCEHWQMVNGKPKVIKSSFS